MLQLASLTPSGLTSRRHFDAGSGRGLGRKSRRNPPRASRRLWAEARGGVNGPPTVMIWSIGKGKLDSCRADLMAEVTKGVVAHD
jgi:hypothetical protein